MSDLTSLPDGPSTPGATERDALRADAQGRLAAKLDAALDALEQAEAFAKVTYQTELFQIASTLMAQEGGHRVLYERAHRFDEAGVFAGGPWLAPEKLQPSLVGGGLVGAGIYPVIETLSELRVLAIAKGRARSPTMTAEQAHTFLADVMALNLALLFPAATEAERIEGGPYQQANVALFELLADELKLGSLRRDVVSEIEQICAQRPIMTNRVRNMIERAKQIPADAGGTEDDVGRELERLMKAIQGPSPLSLRYEALPDYRKALPGRDEAELHAEAAAFAASMTATGLVCRHHAVLLRHLSAHHTSLLPDALALSDIGRGQLVEHLELARRLIRVAILPATAQIIYGFARLLERGLLSRREVAAGLDRLIELDFHSDVRRALLARRSKRDGVTANSILLSGAIAMLGQPLGVGQGNNPTC